MRGFSHIYMSVDDELQVRLVSTALVPALSIYNIAVYAYPYYMHAFELRFSQNNNQVLHLLLHLSESNSHISAYILAADHNLTCQEEGIPYAPLVLYLRVISGTL